MKDEVRKAVFARATTRWNRTHAKSLIGRLLSPLFSGRLDAILIVEHDDYDHALLLCDGDVKAAWMLNENRVNSIDPSTVEVVRATGRTHVLQFYILPDDSEVIVNEMERPDRGSLLKFAVKPQQAGVKLSVRQCKTVLKGTIVG